MFSTPVLFLIFNRPDTTALVFERIKQIQPKFLFIAADGPRKSIVGEEHQCMLAKDIVLNGIDWECAVTTLFRDENLGCKNAVSGAITWFFDNVEEGIILEDDCLPDLSFFPFAEQMLKEYRDDQEVVAINGCNYGFTCDASSYFFSRYMNAWGWATWRRVVKKINYEIPDWHKRNKISFLRSRLKKQIIDLDVAWFRHWSTIFDMISSGELNTWDYFWFYHLFLFRKKTIVSANNLIKNIGFSDNATHTTLVTHLASDLQISEMHFPIIHPKNRKVNMEYEEKVLKPVCYMYKRNPNSFYIKNVILKLAGVPFLLKTIKNK